MEKIRVLMIDDNINLVNMIKEYFSKNDKISINLEAYDGMEGIDMIENKQNEYDV